MRWILIALVLFFLLPIASAIPNNISINETSFNIESKAFQSKQINFEVFNNGSEPIYNVTFDAIQGFIFNQIPLIPANSKAISNFFASSTEVYEKDFNTKLVFTFDLGVPSNSRTFQVNATQSFFQPNDILIKQDDKILFINKASFTSRIKSIIGTAFDFILITGNSQEYTFSNIEEITYVNEVSGFPLYSGKIKIIDKTTLERIRDASLDIPISIHHLSTQQDTAISLNLFITEIKMNYNDSFQNSLTISNGGLSTAKNIKLSDNLGWISFSQNNFDLDSGKSKLVNFNINPKIALTSETNQTYILKAFVNGTNFESKTGNLEIAVNYSEIRNINLTNLTKEQLIELQKQTEKRIAELIETLTILLNARNSEDGISYIDPTLNFTANASTIRDMFITLSNLKDENGRINNLVNERNIEFITQQGESNQYQNKSTGEITEIKDELKSQRRWGNIKLYAIVLLACVILIYKAMELKKSKKRNEDIYQ